jgi:hypothetical protein
MSGLTNVHLYNALGGKPVRFYGYTSSVKGRVLGLEYGSGLYNQLMNELIVKFRAYDIDAHIDNKIVFEVSNGESSIFIGFYDGDISIGFGVRGDSWIIMNPKGIGSLTKKRNEFKARYGYDLPERS